MRKILLALFGLLLSASAYAQDALVVQTCGTLPLAYSPGATRLLTVDVNGKMCTSGGGGGTPGGSNKQIQFNDSSAFGGNSAFTFDKSNNQLIFGTQSIAPSFSSSTNIFQCGGLDASNNTHCLAYNGIAAGVANFRALGDLGQHLSLSMNGSATANTALINTPLGGSVVTDALSTGGLLINSRAGTSGSWAPIIFALGHLDSGSSDEVGRFDLNGDFSTINNIIGKKNLTLGVVSSATGQLKLANASSANLTTIQAGNAPAARTYTWPTNFGAAGAALTDAAGNGTLSWVTPATAQVAIPASSVTQVSSTGTTGEITLATITVPVLGAGQSTRLTAMFSFVGTAGTRTPRIYYGAAASGTGGTKYSETTIGATNLQDKLQYNIWNRTTSSQFGGTGLSAATGFGPATTAMVTSSVTTTVATELTITGQLANGTDTFNLEGYVLEVLSP